ncbi:MAG: histidine phosphatase family protein [Clostridia bacterium]|nr:histidine phosphatase family protein [Clostridia bacterium]
MKIHIIRHAEPYYAIDGLTEKGHREASLLASRMKALGEKEKILGIYVSPLGRAQATWGYTRDLTGWEAETLPWLCEFRGRCLDPDRQRMRSCWDFRPRTYLSDPLLHDPEKWVEAKLFQGSNVQEIWKETTDGVEKMLENFGYTYSGGVWLNSENIEGSLLLFCHFGVGMAVAAFLTGTSPVTFWQNTCMLPSSVTTLVSEEQLKGEIHFRCTQIGDVSHLYAAGEEPSTAGMFAEIYDGRDSTDPISWGNRH